MFWLMPILGGIVGGMIYRFMLENNKATQ